jgi:PilZ domain
LTEDDDLNLTMKTRRDAMKTYAVRKKLRTPVHFQFCYFCDGTLANGIVWDLSETGWRATGERSVAVGTETTVYLTLSDGKRLDNLLIDAAVVRWSNGGDAGWEIIRMDDANRARLTDFIEQFRAADLTSEPESEIHWY